MPRILVAEDQDRIASFVQKGLVAAGFTVTLVADGDAALDEALRDRHDLLLLDIGLPSRNGMDVLRQLRGSGSDVPVIMLTARNSLADTVAGFEGGADDYLTKPFRFDELLVRIKARIRTRPEASASVAADDRLFAAGAELNLLTRVITCDGATSDLSAREFALAEVFFRHPSQVLSRGQLLSRVWGVDFDPGSNVVDVYVGYLRRKLGAGRLQAVRGSGYRLVPLTRA